MRNKQNKTWMAACVLVVIVVFGSAYTTTGSNFRRPEAPKTRAITKGVQLFKADDRYLLERGTPLLITTPKGPQGPVVLYGADYKGQVVTGYDQGGHLHDFPMADIQHIQVIKDGTVGWGLGIGAAVGLLVGFSILGFNDCEPDEAGDDDHCEIPSVVISGYTALGGLSGASLGGIVGGIMSIDKDFPIGKTGWQIQTRPTPVPAPKEPTKIEEKDESKEDDNDTSWDKMP